MKIAVSSTGKELTSEMDTRFGRAPYFLIIDSETMAFEAVDNSQSTDAAHGAGIMAGKSIVDRGVSVLLTGICGPKAYQVLNQAGIRIVTDQKGSVIDAVKKFLKT